MAEAKIEFGVAAEVEMSVGPKMAAWLISLGWTPPVDEQLESEGEELGLWAEKRTALTGAEAYELQQREAGL